MARSTPGRPWRRGASAWIATLLLLPQAATPWAAAIEPSPPSQYVLDEGGRLFVWQPGADRLVEISAALLQALGPVSVKDLAPLEGNRLLLLATRAHDAGGGSGTVAHSRNREGIAVVVGTTPQTKIERTIAFRGDGYAVVTTADGRRAFILAQQGSPAGLEENIRSWVHEIEPDSGRVVGSVAVSGPAFGLAIDPGGRRVFVSRRDRILTCTTAPLLNSWFYRSPGINGALRFPPGSDILLAIRDHEVARFDPAALAALSEEKRRERVDDATAVIPLPAAASDLRLAEAGGLALAIGEGSLSLVDLERTSAFAIADLPDPVRQAGLIELLRFPAPPGDLLLALFPSHTVAAIPGPVLEPPPAAPPPADPVPAQPIPAEPTPARPAPLEPAPPAAIPVPEPAVPVAIDSSILRGRITGERRLAAVIVLYGPDNIVKERTRVTPDAGGLWTIPLPPPGRYRLVPLGDGSRPLRSRPDFQTVVVGGGQVTADLDFEILGKF